MSCWLPLQDSMTMVMGVRASTGAEDNGSRMAVGYCPRVIDRSFFPGMEQCRLGALKSRLLASEYSTMSLSH